MAWYILFTSALIFYSPVDDNRANKKASWHGEDLKAEVAGYQIRPVVVKTIYRKLVIHAYVCTYN